MKQNIKNYLSIDWEMVPAKLTFFFTDGYFGSILPFINNYYVSLGLSATHAGIISGISLAVSSLFNPLWSTIADATGYRKLIFCILCLGTGSTVFSMPWIEQSVAKTVKSNSCNDSTINNSTDKKDCKEISTLVNVSTLFYALLALNIVAWIFFTSLRCYVDGIVSNVSNTREKKRSYGTQRAVSCMGYAFFNVVTGVITDHYHPKSGLSPYTAVFYVFLPCVVCMVPIGLKLVKQTKWNEDESAEKESKRGISLQFLVLFKRLDFVIFFISVMVYGITLNVYNCFFFMLMEHELKSTKTLMSIALAIGVLFEISLFMCASKVIKMLHGTIPSLIIGLLSFTPRYILMSYIENPYFVLISQPLHALGLALAWSAIVEHTYKLVPPEIKVSAIAIMSSIVFVASAAAVNIGGGLIYDAYGGRLFFRYSGIMAGIWTVIMICYFKFQQRKISSTVAVETNVSSAVVEEARYPDGIFHEVDLEEPKETTEI